MKFTDLNESQNLDEFLGFGKKKGENVPPPEVAARPAPKQKPVARDPLQQQWNSVRDDMNADIASAGTGDTTSRQFAADLKDFADAVDDAFKYINDERAFKQMARTAAQKYVILNQKYFSKSMSTRADGASSELSMGGQALYATINKKLLPFFKALQKRII